MEICGGVWRRVRRVGLCWLAVSVAAAVLVIVPASPVSSQADSGGWWDGSEALAAAPPVVVEQGWCSSYGGWLGLFGGGPLAKVCVGAPGAAPGAVSGSPRGVGWFEGYDADGPHASVELFGAPAVAADTYRALGEFDVIFDGGTFTVDFAECAHRAGTGYSSCVTRVPGAPLPPGSFVGVATPGTEPPARAPRGIDESTRTPAAERAALVALYNATGGANWPRNTNWNTTAAVSTWYGVTTNSEGSVTDLYLYVNNLSGTIPAALGDLTNLTELGLAGNSLSGSIPAELGDLNNLTVLRLESNGLSGSIPAELGDLTNLTHLYLRSNSLSGSVPAELGDLTSLTVLDLSSNDLSRSVPAELGDLTNLTVLYLYGNGLSGSLPAELGDLTNLAWLRLESNGLSGSVPAELGDLANLTHLSLRGNGLSGSVPAELGDLANLTYLSLYDNGLSGSIPAELGDLANLIGLYLGRNGLSGSIPAELGDLANLRWLYLDGNGLSGSIPAELGGLANLAGLSLSGNGLSGSVPAELSDLTNLRLLYLDRNRLSGCVPAALAAVEDIRFDPDLSYCGSLELVSAVLLGGSAVELIYDSDLDETSVPTVGAFSVSVDSTSRTTTGVTVAGRTVTLTLASPALETQSITVSYVVPATGAKIQTTGGDDADGFTDQPVVVVPLPGIVGVAEVGGVLTASTDGISEALALSSPMRSYQWIRSDGATDTPIVGATSATYTLTSGDVGYRIKVEVTFTEGGYTVTLTSAPTDSVAPAAPTNLTVAPGDRNLVVTWVTVPGVNAYDVEYRKHDETLWHSYRTGIRESFTIGGLQSQFLYWVRVRGVKTDGGPDEATLYRLSAFDGAGGGFGCLAA